MLLNGSKTFFRSLERPRRLSLQLFVNQYLVQSLFGTMSYPSEENMKKFLTQVQTFLKSEDGPTAVEYAIGTNANSAFQDIANDLNDARAGNVN